MANGISPITTNFGPATDQSGSTISKRNIFENYERIDTTKKSIQVVGKTGSGKSTLVNYLIGNIKQNIKDGSYVVNEANAGPKIGHTLSSQTVFSKMYQIPCDNAELFVQDNGGFFDVRDIELIKQIIALTTAETYLSTPVKGTIVMINEDDFNAYGRASQFEQTLKELIKISHLSDRTDDIFKHLTFIITPNKNELYEHVDLSEERINGIKTNFFKTRDNYVNRLNNDALFMYLKQCSIGESSLDENLIIKLGLCNFFLKYKSNNFENYDHLFNQFFDEQDFDLVNDSLKINHYTFKDQLKIIMDDCKDNPFVLPNSSFHEVLLNINPHNLFVANYENQELKNSLIERYTKNEPLRNPTTEQLEKTSTHNDIHIFSHKLRDEFSDSKNIIDHYNYELNKITALLQTIEDLELKKINSNQSKERIKEIKGEDILQTNVIDSKKNIHTLKKEISDIRDKQSILGHGKENYYTILDNYDGRLRKVEYIRKTKGILGTIGKGIDHVVWGSKFLGAGYIGVPRQSLQIHTTASSDNPDAKIEYTTNVAPKSGNPSGFIINNSDHKPAKRNSSGQLVLSQQYVPFRFTREEQGVSVEAKIKTIDNGRNRTKIKELDDLKKNKESLMSIKEEIIESLERDLSSNDIDEKIVNAKGEIIEKVKRLFEHRPNFAKLTQKIENIQTDLDMLEMINNLMIKTTLVDENAKKCFNLLPIIIKKQGINTFFNNDTNDSLYKSIELLKALVKDDGIMMDNLRKITSFSEIELNQIHENRQHIFNLFRENQ